MCVISPKIGNGSPPLHQALKPAQVNSPASFLYRTFLKQQKMASNLWAYTYATSDKLWYQIDADGVPGEYKLKEWLADSTVRAMLTSPTVKSLTFKEHMTGPNISRVQAENNSEE